MTNSRYLVLLPALLASCSPSPAPVPPARAALARPVSTLLLTPTEWPSIHEATGTVQARHTTVVAARTMGYVRDVMVQAGDRVRAGQLLLRIDSRETDLSLRRAQAMRDEIVSALPEADSAIHAARSQLELAQSTQRRLRELLDKKSVTLQEFDEANARLKSAESQLQMALARRKQVDSRLAQAEESIAAAGLAQSYSTLTAPFAAIVSAKTVEPGTLATPGQPLLTLEREGAYQLEAAVEQTKLFGIRPGQTVSVFLGGRAESFPARVSEIVPTLDPQTHTGTIKIALPFSPDLRSGLFGRAQFPGAPRSVLAVPAAAIREQGQLKTVFVVENQVASARLVTLGVRRGDEYEVLSGLAPQERVVALLPPGLVDGAHVEAR